MLLREPGRIGSLRIDCLGGLRYPKPERLPGTEVAWLKRWKLSRIDPGPSTAQGAAEGPFKAI